MRGIPVTMRGIPVTIGKETYYLRFTRFTAQDVPLGQLSAMGDGHIEDAIKTTNDILILAFRANYPELGVPAIKKLITQYDDEQEDAGSDLNFGDFIKPLTDSITGFFGNKKEKKEETPEILEVLQTE